MITINPNTIKLSIIAAILTLICISCAVNHNPLDSKVISSYTNAKEEYTNVKEEYTKNSENASGDLNSLNQKSPKETAIAKLKEFGNKLEAQKNEETTKIAKNPTKGHFADLVGVYPVYYGKDKEAKEKLEKAIQSKLYVASTEIQEAEKLQIERIIQASLNYDSEKINKLKKILETLKGSEEHKDPIRLLLYNKALDIQKQLDEYLELIKKDSELNTLSLQKLKELLIHVEFDLMLKEKLKETLKKTVDEVSQRIEEIEKDYFVEKNSENGISQDQIAKIENSRKIDYILGYIAENYLIFDYVIRDAKFKQEKFNELQNN
ncbi:complement regulator-acquiring protein (plasmid) [Borreliella andersonii]|uniref:Complement regulator-acquiring protein n=1 Tax=Borrelia andersonii TaxID=42109 RepID=A0ABZ0CGC7_BORAD|nr:complement regulator-acquiring protein [Borreliella andersonii]WNY66386.1 complement regulator-acquiring protein [Borreliella andersonii]